ncbi:MAG: Protein translocase subunit SecF [Parcubacteria group bacterium GW2011_GWA2_52_8]|nr:MAG: Protein translocase subunit SecF [Parcubacteria group bacterium GW2011_GWA2_52_8]
MFSVTKYYKVWFAFSGILLVAAIAAVAVWGLHLGIDFVGGSRAEFEFVETPEPGQVRSELAAAGIADALVQSAGENRLVIKTKNLTETEKSTVEAALLEKFGEYQEISFQNVGPTIGRELLNRAYWQIVLVVLGIVLYITYAFRKIGKQMRGGKVKAWHLGVATVIALTHDLMIPVGVFAALGHFRGVEVDSLFITALLTILGFSVHDTIVVFDRVRENLQKHPYLSIQSVIDYSVASTFARSINTSSTLMFVLTALLLFGGQSIF